MDFDLLALHAAAAVAAFLQSVTGIGFGMIAGPVILVVLAEPAAVVVTTFLTWLISAALVPFVWRDVDPRLVGRLAAGAVLGLPVGLALLAAADVTTLKLAAGMVIVLLTVLMLVGAPGTNRPGLGGDLVFGGLGGVFGAGVAIPGPTAAIRIAGIGNGKAILRATMVGFFVVVTPPILLGQWATTGPGAATLTNALALAPATLAGLAAGHYAAGRVSERFFRLLVVVLLLATAASLLGNVIWEWTVRGGA